MQVKKMFRQVGHIGRRAAIRGLFAEIFPSIPGLSDCFSGVRYGAWKTLNEHSHSIICLRVSVTRDACTGRGLSIGPREKNPLVATHGKMTYMAARTCTERNWLAEDSGFASTVDDCRRTQPREHSFQEN